MLEATIYKKNAQSPEESPFIKEKDNYQGKASKNEFPRRMQQCHVLVGAGGFSSLMPEHLPDDAFSTAVRHAATPALKVVGLKSKKAFLLFFPAS